MTQPDEIRFQRDLTLVRDRRDEAAFGRLYDAYSPLLYRVCLLILKSEVEAQEALQDAFVHLWERCEGFDPSRGRLYTWLCLVTRSKAIDRLRRNQRLGKKVALTPEGDLEPSLGKAPQPGPDALQLSLDADRRVRVQALLAQLPEAQYRVLALAYYEGLTQSEIAHKTRRPLGTVKTQMRTALRRLAALAGPELKAWL